MITCDACWGRGWISVIESTDYGGGIGTTSIYNKGCSGCKGQGYVWPLPDDIWLQVVYKTRKLWYNVLVKELVKKLRKYGVDARLYSLSNDCDDMWYYSDLADTLHVAADVIENDGFSQ